MTRLMILVEGETEEAFVNNVLTPHLRPFHIECVPSCVTTSAKQKGGGVRYPKVRKEILSWMKQEPGLWVTTMFDLYKLDADFPQFEDTKKNADPRRRADCLEEAFKKDVVDDTYWRFIPYIQVHEYEAILYCDLDKLMSECRDCEAKIEQLKKSVQHFESPEHVDDDPETSPSKRLIKAIPRYKGDKTRIGPIVAEKIGLDCIRSKCAHFAGWLGALESIKENP